MTTDAPRSANAFTVAAGGDEDLGDTRKRRVKGQKVCPESRIFTD